MVCAGQLEGPAESDSRLWDALFAAQTLVREGGSDLQLRARGVRSQTAGDAIPSYARQRRAAGRQSTYRTDCPGSMLLDVGYVGTQTRHGLARRPFNEPGFGAAWLPQNQDPTRAVTPTTVLGDNALPVDLYRPYPGYVGVGVAVGQSGLGAGGFLSTYGSSANYNALQVGLNRRVARSLMFGVAYTWSKAMGTDTDYQFVGNPLDHRKADYGLLTFDRSQDLVFNYSYNLPSVSRRGSLLDNPAARLILDHWQVTGITSFVSGAPVAVGSTAVNQASAIGGYAVQGI